MAGNVPATGRAALRARYAEIAARLAPNASEPDREGLKAEIIALFRAVEEEIAELGALKNDVRVLVDRWKALGECAQPAEERAAPPQQSSGSQPAVGLAPAAPSEPRPVLQADHLGASTYIEKGWSQLAMGDPVAAEQSLLRALQLAPGDTHAEALLGWAQMRQEKYDEALWLFQKVLLREPGNAIARVNVGFICLKKGIFGEAIEHLSHAIQDESDRKATLYAHFYLGLVYLEREMFDDAEGFFRRTIALGPNLIEAHYELGRALWLGGNADGARDVWREGFAANRFSPWGKRCAEALEIVAAGGVPPRGV
ncbi:MAG TPA: tetratricopeptide repeat protein [Gemmatimonadaceae bacterium]|nr:tetratricopeptide repeat protein [Gemmatimonadaceae bacterium]